MATLNAFLICLACCCWQPTLSHAQTTDTLRWQLKKHIAGEFTTFTADNLGNVYLINANNQIKKLNQQLDSVGLYNDVKRFGNIAAIDVSNPLKILVYYRKYAAIAILDRFLNYRTTINLRQQNLLQVKCMAQSFDNHIWLFDEWDNKVKKMNDAGNIVQEFTDCRLLFDQPFSPNSIVDADGLVYLYHPEVGFKVFNYLGALRHQYPLLHWKDVHVSNGLLIGRDNQYQYTWQPKQLLQTQKAAAWNNALQVVYQQNHCYVLRNDGLYIYQLL